MALGIPDELLPVLVPPVFYWIAAGIYHLVLGSTDKYQLFTKEEEESQNLATRREVLTGVLLNQAMQIALAALVFMFTGTGDGKAGAAARPASLLEVAWQLAVGMLIMDFWGYFWHRLVHENKFLFRHVHGMHHKLIVPYAYGGQYIHPVDAMCGEIASTVFATVITGMSHRTSLLFIILLAFKGMDDHCSMWFPNYHPLHRWMTNNTAFHSSHHLHQGFKYNYSQHYMATWDFLLGTYLPYSVKERKDGGYQITTPKDPKDA
uniref:aldehyde oxygenase (deformylating) n=1 Tax=Anthurium amnicola TaxID=1678845 RepID=A0A1D1Z3M8_9ARAE